MQMTPDSTHTHGNVEDIGYATFVDRVQATFALNAYANGPLFTTNVKGLWDEYIASFPVETRQYHNCNTCRHFIERFGGLVFIDNNGDTVPLWRAEDANDDERRAVAGMERLVWRAEVTGVFLSSAPVLGQPTTDIWRHLSITLPNSLVHKGALLTPYQAMAEKLEDFKNMQRALDEFTRPQIDQALKLLRSDALYGGEKTLGPAEFLSDLRTLRDQNRRNDTCRNLTWKRIALAPSGFCHPRSSMIGSLLEDIATGAPFDAVSKRFADKMHPLAYQRPQAAPSAGAIAAAEQVFQKLGAGGALARRYATFDDLQPLWVPVRQPATAAEGLFGHLAPKQPASSVPDMVVPALEITFEKFRRKVLPTADRIELLAPHGLAAWTQFVTAENADAAPILQWDSADARNPVSWYLYSGGSSATQFGVMPGRWVDVDGLVFKPSMWRDEDGMPHHGKGVVLVAKGAGDTRAAGAALFPSIMRAEFHGVRAVLEAYSNRATIAGMDAPKAAGLLFEGGHTSITVRVTTGGTVMHHKIDRWD